MSDLVHLTAGGYFAVRPAHKNRGVSFSVSMKDASHGASFTATITPAEARELASRLGAIAGAVEHVEGDPHG